MSFFPFVFFFLFFKQHDEGNRTLGAASLLGNREDFLIVTLVSGGSGGVYVYIW